MSRPSQKLVLTALACVAILAVSVVGYVTGDGVLAAAAIIASAVVLGVTLLDWWWR